MDVVRLDRRTVWRSALLTFLLTWPLILFGRPAYFYDSVNYYHGGRVAVAFAIGKFASRFEPATLQTVPFSTGGDATLEKPASKGARSILYS
jgi:hypothetical protein